MFQKAPESDTHRGRLREATVAVLKGVVGGILGTATMTVYRAPLFAGLPPTAEFWARFIGDGEPSEYPIQALVLHVLYGAGAGGVFGLVSARADLDLPGGRASVSMVLASVYSILLSVFGSRLLLRRLLGIELTSKEALVFHVGHVIYGLSLGTWLGTGNLIGRSKDDG
ncbi:hypothetical protein Halar_2037 [halophilic archaeon DL31]|jgi:hypothetical protein|nr:hypothetical protein Halar_2037 [halophilic archaeon DL31]